MKVMELFHKVENRLFCELRAKGCFNCLSDEQFIRLRWRTIFHESLNLKEPETFSEKLQWLKLYNHRPEYTRMVDKYEGKEYVSEIIGNEYIIPTLGVWDSFDDIDFEFLPNKFVLKCTHDSGGLVICRDKNKLNLQSARQKLEKSLRTNYYLVGREWPYKNVKPRIIAEQYMDSIDSEGLVDYKFYCFNGEPKFLYVSRGMENHKTARLDFLTLDWERTPFYRTDYMHFGKLPEKPVNFEKMISVARILSKGIPFLRVDLYEIKGHLYWSELTFFPGGGVAPISPIEWEREIGSWIRLERDDQAIK